MDLPRGFARETCAWGQGDRVGEGRLNKNVNMTVQENLPLVIGWTPSSAQFRAEPLWRASI